MPINRLGDKYGLGNFLKDKAKASSAENGDPEAKAKQERARSRDQIAGSQSALQRARRTRSLDSIRSQLRHNAESPIHPLWEYLPSEQRTRQALLQLRLRRLRSWLQQRRQSIQLILITYVVFWSIPLLIGQALMTVFALLPLLLVPPVGYLIYWLVWKEFHA